MSVDFSKALLNAQEINLASDFPASPDVEVVYQVNADLTVPAGKPGAGQVLHAGDVVAWDIDPGEYVLMDGQNRVWRKQANGTPATETAEAIIHAGNVAVGGSLASRKAADNTTTGTLNNVDASGTSLIRFTAGQTVTGFANAVDGQYLTVMNASSALSLTISNNSTSSFVAARVDTGLSMDLVIAPSSAVLLQYDAVALRWKLLSETNLGYVASFAQVAANVAQSGIVANTNITFNTVTASSGTDITVVSGGVRLKAGKTYRMRGFVPWSQGNWLNYKWHDGTAFIGYNGYNEHATSTNAVGSGGAAEAIVSPTVDTTYYMRCLNAGGAVTTTASTIPHAFIEVLSGREPATSIKLYSRLYTGTAPDPNVVSPGEAIEGYTYLQEDSTGYVFSHWQYDGAKWVRLTASPSPVAAAADGGALRTYHPSRSAFVPYWTVAPTAAQIAAHGFTAVGGATLGATSYGQRQWINCTATQGTEANRFAPPTSYIRHDIAINGDVDSMYHIGIENDYARSQLDVWVCDPVTGVPVERLATTDQSFYGGGHRWAQHIAPDNGRGINGYYSEWLGHHIPAAVVAARKTVSGTLKLAIRPGGYNGGNTTWRIGGYAMTTNPFGLCVSPAMGHASTPTSNGVWTTSTSIPQWAGNITGTAMGYVPDNGVAYIRVPVADTSKDTYLLLPGRYANDNNFAGIECTIKHTSGDVLLGRPSISVPSPYMAVMDGWNVQRQGYIIPAATLASKTIKPANSAVSYIDLYLNNTASNMQAHFAGVVTEYINP